MLVIIWKFICLNPYWVKLELFTTVYLDLNQNILNAYESFKLYSLPHESKMYMKNVGKCEFENLHKRFCI